MTLFIGEKELFDFVCDISPDITYDIGVESADKLIVCDSSDASVAAVRAAHLINIPVLGILGGYQAVAAAFGARCEPLDNCAEGKQEWAVIDCSSPVYTGLESVIKICRGKPVAVIEATLPPELDCMSRAETGEIIAFRSITSAETHGDIYAINYYPASELTPDGRSVIENFIKL